MNFWTELVMDGRRIALVMLVTVFTLTLTVEIVHTQLPHGGQT